MSTRGAVSAERRSTTLSAGIALLAILVLANAATLAAPIPVPVIVISVALAIASAVAIVGSWIGRSWGRWVGSGAAVATAVAAAPGIFEASGPLPYVAGATIVIGIACAGLLLIPASGRTAHTRPEEG